MNPDAHLNATIRLRDALRTPDAPARLQAALAAGTHPRDDYIDVLIDRCAVEPDFYVRDMLTWALTRQHRESTTQKLLAQLSSDTAQARSQSLHTLSKIGDPDTWPAITPALLRDDDTEVARAAWRTAVALAPDPARAGLASELATQFGRGDREMQRSLSRAFAALGAHADAVVERAGNSPDPDVRAHAVATIHVMADPDRGFDEAIDHARRVVALRAAPRNAEE